MSCKRYSGDLADAVAGEGLTTEFQDHLQDCETCRRRLAEGRLVLGAVDRELGAALAIEPSAALLARVQERVALVELAPVDSSRVAAAWRIAATVAVAAGVAGSVWLLRPGAQVGKTPPRMASASPSMPVDLPRHSDSTAPAPTGAATSEAPVPAFPSDGATSQPNTAKRQSSASPVRRVSLQPTEPEVLMPPGEAALFARFVTSLRTRTVEPSSLLVARSAEGLPEPKPIELSPLEIRPLSEGFEPVDDGRTE